MTAAPYRPVPLSPERFKVTFTTSRELKDELERLQALIEGDLEAVIEAAVTEKLERLEAKRFAATSSTIMTRSAAEETIDPIRSV
jgi:hypothetical protein